MYANNFSGVISRIEGGRRVIQLTSFRSAPAITIVTVVYNRRELLLKTVYSVLARKREDIHHIVIDGASTDGTVETLQSLGDRIEYWISESDCGIYNAMNKAVKLAAQDSYILFLGAGDLILRLPEAEIITAASAAGSQLLYGDVLIGNRLFKSTFNTKLKYRNTLHHQGLFVRKSSPNEIWFDESFAVFSDWNFNLELFTRGIAAWRLEFTVAYAEPNGVSAEIHLFEIARLVVKQCGPFSALLAVIYHGSLHFARYYAGIFSRSRE